MNRRFYACWAVGVLFYYFFSTPTYAAQVLVYLPIPINAAELAHKDGHIIRDLHPLPWLVVEKPVYFQNKEVESLVDKLPPKGKNQTNRFLNHNHTRRMLRTDAADVITTGFVQPDVQGHFAATPSLLTEPNDPHYAEQWHLTDIGVSSLWEKTQGERVIIALLDSGVDPEHPDLVGNILFDYGYDLGDEDDKPYDANGHGTAMAGLMVAKCHNKTGGCGVAPSAKVIPYKINSQGEDQFSSIDLAVAIVAAAGSEAHIISMSLVLDEYAPWVEHAIEYAKLKNKIVVAAAGNQNSSVAFPANLSWVIGVGAYDKEGQRLPSSNFGNGLSLTAPGVDLLTTLPGTDYANWYHGTSAAAALVSGVLALMIAQQPNATAPELMVTLLVSCQDAQPAGFDELSGFGHLKATRPQISSLNPEPSLSFAPASAEVIYLGEVLQLALAFNNVSGQAADLYLRLNLPDQNIGIRSNLFKVWESDDSHQKIPYNDPLASPYLLTGDFVLPLYGTPTALLDTGLVDFAAVEGPYELLALLTFIDSTSIQARKIIWITDERLLN